MRSNTYFDFSPRLWYVIINVLAGYYDPERFTPERAAGRPRYAYFPFGGGPRMCIGSTFAMTEAQLVLATIAQRYSLSLVPGHPVEPEPFVTLRLHHGVMMKLHARA